MTLSPERYAGLLELESSPDPPTSRLRPRPTSFVPKSSRSRLASTLEICLSLCSNNICGQLKPDRNSTADVFHSDKRAVLQTARDASWQDPLTRHGLSVTPQDEQPEAPTALQDQQWRRMRKKDFSSIARRCGTCTDCGSPLHSSISCAIWFAGDSHGNC